VAYRCRHGRGAGVGQVKGVLMHREWRTFEAGRCPLVGSRWGDVKDSAEAWQGQAEGARGVQGIAVRRAAPPEGRGQPEKRRRAPPEEEGAARRERLGPSEGEGQHSRGSRRSTSYLNQLGPRADSK